MKIDWIFLISSILFFITIMGIWGLPYSKIAFFIMLFGMISMGLLGLFSLYDIKVLKNKYGDFK